MSIDYVVALVGVGGTIIVTALGVLKAKKDDKKSTIEDATKDTIVTTKLDYISKGVDDIRLDIKAQDKRITEVVERVIKIEEVCKQLDYRIDVVEEKK